MPVGVMVSGVVGMVVIVLLVVDIKVLVSGFHVLSVVVT